MDEAMNATQRPAVISAPPRENPAATHLSTGRMSGAHRTGVRQIADPEGDIRIGERQGHS